MLHLLCPWLSAQGTSVFCLFLIACQSLFFNKVAGLTDRPDQAWMMHMDHWNWLTISNFCYYLPRFECPVTKISLETFALFYHFWFSLSISLYDMLEWLTATNINKFEKWSHSSTKYFALSVAVLKKRKCMTEL